MRQINDLVVHCSATAEGRDFSAADIDRWHRERGWSGIGYHFVIRLDGTLEPGRPLQTPGAHVAGHNARSIGICLIGGIDAKGKSKNTFTEAQMRSLVTLLKDLRARYPATRILGHRDYPGVAKDCPCFDVRAWCTDQGIRP